MSYRILTKNAVENTNIDGARDHNFNAGRRSGIVQGALNSGNLFLSANNTIALDTCELRLCGHRVVIDNAEYKTFYNQPSVPIRYSLVAQIIVSNNGESVSFDLKTQLSTTPLVQNDLDKNINGTYELEIGRFTQLTDGTLTDVVRTADLITGGGNNDSEYIRIGTVTTNKISPELDADVDIENTINPDDNKPQTNFTFNLPTPSGTVVSVAGEEKTSINTDTTPTANSQNLVTSGGVHDYPAVTFAEAERQKSKNLFNANDVVFDNSTYGYIPIKNVDNLYCLSLQNDRGGDLENISFGVCKDPTSASSVIEQGYFWIIDGGNKLVNVVVSNITNRPYVFFYPKSQHTLDLVLARFDVQIEEGSVATDYQPYNGAIVHDKQLNEAVEKRELLYNNDNAINISDSSLTTLQEYFDLFEQDTSKVYKCGFGKLETNNFTNLLGVPSSFSNYGDCYIKMEVARPTGNNSRETYKLIAISGYSNDCYIGYIYQDYNSTILFTGWTKIGG